MNLKIIGGSQVERSISAVTAFGSTRGMLSGKPPPVMWAMPLILILLSNSRETGLRKLLWTVSSAPPIVWVVPGSLSKGVMPQMSKITRRAREKPFVWRPSAGRPMITSPARMDWPVITLFLETVPTIVPVRSYSPTG